LTSTESQYCILRLTGTLTVNLSVTTLSQGFFYVENLTSGNYSVSISNGVGSVCLPPQGMRSVIISDSSTGVRLGVSGGDFPGAMKIYAGASGTLPPWLAGEWLFCDGSAVSRSTYALLFQAIGTTWGIGDGVTTFNIPDFRGRIPVGRDNMGGVAAGRMTLANGFDGTVLGNVGGEQVHTLTSTEMPSHTHTASVTDPGHTHGLNMYNGAGGVTYPTYQTGVSTVNTTYINTATTGISVSNSNTGGGTAHNIVQPSGIVNYLIKI